MTITHNNFTQSMIAEFQQRNPDRQVIIDYASDLEDGHGVEVLVPDDPSVAAVVVIDLEAPMIGALQAIAKSLGVIEAGYDAEDDDREAAIEHYWDCLNSDLETDYEIH